MESINLIFNIVQDHGDKLFLFIQKLNDDPRLKKRLTMRYISILPANPLKYHFRPD